MNPVRKNLLIDAAALIVYLVAANPAITGVPVHEWLGLGILVVFVVHCVVHYDWAADVVRNLAGAPRGARGNLILDVLILIAFMAVTVSGIGISGAVLPAFGLFADGYYFWNPLHAIAAKVLLALILIHVVVHAKWLCRALGRAKKDAGEATGEATGEEAGGQ